MPSKNDQPYKGKANLSILFGDDEADNSSKNSVPLNSIELPSSQPRRYFDSQSMQSLVESIKTDGILQPLLVRPLSQDKYELVAGERRYRAAKEVGLTEVPVVIREFTEQQALHIALVENLQREDLNPVEETEGILELLSSELGCHKEDAIRLLYRMQNDIQRKNDNVIIQPEAETVIKIFTELGLMSWESFVSNRLSLLKLPENILEALRKGQIEYTKARAIAKIKDEEARNEMLDAAIADDLSLTQIKERVAALKTDAGEEKAEDTLKTQIKAALTKVNKSKVWDDPKKQKRLQKILTDLESLLTT